MTGLAEPKIMLRRVEVPEPVGRSLDDSRRIIHSLVTTPGMSQTTRIFLAELAGIGESKVDYEPGGNPHLDNCAARPDVFDTAAATMTASEFAAHVASGKGKK